VRFLVTDATSLEQLGQRESLDADGTSIDFIISWNTFADSSTSTPSRVIHLGELLHDREESLQRMLLDWLGSLAAKHTADDSSLPLVYPNLHAWWLLTITEKNYVTMPELTTLLKLILLHEICSHGSVTSIRYEGSNRKLEAVLHEFAGINGWRSNTRSASLLTRLVRRTETPQAFANVAIAFIQAIFNCVRRKASVKPTIALVGYLVPAFGTSRAQSHYWGNLEDLLPKGNGVLWLYHRAMPLRPALYHCSKSEEHGNGHHHRLIEDFVTLSAVLKTVKTYISWRNARRRLLLEGLGGMPGGRNIAVTELFASHMHDSLSGSRAISSILHCHVYDEIVRNNPKTKWLYLWENKTFEHALTSAVHRHSSGTSVGYAHSVVRRRDNRYFEEMASAPLTHHVSRPAATVYAVNGELPLRHLRDVGMPLSEVVEVEALRYSSLSVTPRDTGTRILVVGDINANESRRLLDLTHAAVASANSQLSPWFKPHPGSPHHAEMALSAGFTVSNDPLATLAPDLALAVVGAAGAASIDLTMLGVPVATVLDPESMNLSPLVGVAGAYFVRSVPELRAFIDAPRLHDLRVESIMHRDNPPRRWLNLLEKLA